MRRELKALRLPAARGERGGVSFEGRLEHALRACLWSRTAMRVLLELRRFPAGDAASLYDGARAVDWPGWLTDRTTLAVEASVTSSGITHSGFALIVNGAFEEGVKGWTPDPAHVVVAEAGAAASGQACLSGEITAPNTHLTLRQRVTVKAGNRYQFQIAARGTNKTKIVLWVRRGGQRLNVAAWENLTPAWRTYTAPLAVESDGTMELELIAPSSHNAPPGRIWLDDVSLAETAMPQVTSVSGDGGFNDEPAMAQADDGSLYAAWNSFRDGFDSLQVG